MRVKLPGCIISLAVLLGSFCAIRPAEAQAGLEEYRVYNDHPRLLLTSQRLRLLKRERDRDTMRWHQFSLLVRSAAEMPEPGFALALYYQVTSDEVFGKRAVEWALGPGTDLRQLALVYDWCQTVMTRGAVQGTAGEDAAVDRAAAGGDGGGAAGSRAGRDRERGWEPARRGDRRCMIRSRRGGRRSSRRGSRPAKL